MLSGLEILVIVGLLLLLAELFIGIEAGFDLVAIGSVLILGGLIGIGTDSYLMVIILVVVFSALYILFGRRLVRKKFTAHHKKTNVDRLLAQLGRVLVETSSHQAGLVTIDGEEWRAKSKKTLPAGTEVQVKSVDGVTLFVEPIPDK